MRRIAAVIAGSFVVAGVWAAPASATFHLEMSNEVMLASSTGDTAVQFVELLDNGGSEEAFTPVFSPYKLVIYDAAGNKVGEHQLDPNGLRAAAAADREYLLSTPAADTAFGVTADEPLDVQLPAVAGQACFEANPDPHAFSCLTWGAITKPVATNSMGTGSVNGSAPPNGKSEQRLQNNSVVSASPTPKARNKADAGGPSGMPPPFAGVGFPRHRVKVNGAGHARVRLTCPAASGGCSGRLKLRSAAGKRKPLGPAAKFEMGAGRSTRVTVKLNAGTRKRLARKHRLKAGAVAIATDSSGQSHRSVAQLVLVT
jgi:hypothetical protein